MEHISPRRGIVSILIETFRGYGWYLAILTILAILTAAADGISIAAIVPILSFLVPSSAESAGGTITQVMQSIFSLLHIPFQFRFMVLFVTLLIFGRAVLMSIFVLLRSRGNGRFLSEKIEELYGLLFAVRWQFILREKAGYLQNIIIWDTKRAGQLLDAIVQCSQSVTGFAVYLALAIVISPSITLATIGAGVVLVLLLRPIIRRTRHFSEETAWLEKDIAQHVGEHVQGFKVVKASGASPFALAAVHEYLVRFRRAFTGAIFVQSLTSIFIQPFSFLFAMALFAFSYYSGTFNLAAFAATLYLIQKIFTYLDSAQSSFGAIVQLVPYAESILTFKERAMRESEEERTGGKPFSFESDIVFKDVMLSYENKSPALNNISFSILRGSFLGIVGPSGGGKTSLADLLLRLFAPSEGEILLDGVATGDIDLAAWHRHVAYVSQEAFLLHASIRDNIRFYDASVTDIDIEEAARTAHIYEDIMRMPEGFDTILGDRGATLSGGQRQRVALARALARKPAVLVLDEVTSALDSELEAQIKRVVEELRGKVTLVVIAHRVSTVLNADRILVLEAGKVISDETPERMLADKDSYLSRMRVLQQGSLTE